MFKQAYYKGLIKIAQGIPYNPAQHDLPRQWFTDRGYTQDQYNEYKGKGYSLSPFTRGQFIRDLIQMKRKAKQLQEAAKAQGKDPNNVSGTFRHGKLVQLGNAEPGASVPAQPRQRIQSQKQPPVVTKLDPARQSVYAHNKQQIHKAAPAQARPQTPTSSPNTQIRHKGYTWTPFIDGAAARKYYGESVVGTKINGQTYYRPFDTTGGTRTGSYVRSAHNTSRPGRRVVVPAYRRVL